MSYNYRQHNINVDKRRHFNLSTNLCKSTPLEKILLSLMSPLPNDQDFAINICAVMNSDPKNTFRLSECPKLIDILLAHVGIYADFTLRSLFENIYENIRRHSQFEFWCNLLYDKPHILAMCIDEEAWIENGIIERDVAVDFNALLKRLDLLTNTNDVSFLNLKRGHGKDEYMGQRILQLVQILRNISFTEENTMLLAKNKTFLRYIIMGANVRWNNMHIEILETAGNIANELDLSDPTTDELSRCLISTVCEGVDSTDRAVVINCLEILRKLCSKENNVNGIQKCLNLEFYKRLCQLLSLKDLMLVIYDLEAIYALSSLGSRSCSLLMQVRGAIDQLVSLLTIESGSYGSESCIMMRLIESSHNIILPVFAHKQQQQTVTNNLQNGQIIQTRQQQHKATHSQGQINDVQPKMQMQMQTVHNVPNKEQQSFIKQPVAVGIMAQQREPNTQSQKPFEKTLQLILPKENTTQQQQQQVKLPATTATPTPTPMPPIINITAKATPSPPPPTQNSFTHDDEQYALAWLASTCERAATNISRIEQQELYRIYLSHCQKAGKVSLVNHIQFPRLVRMIFGQSVGPVLSRSSSDESELDVFYYVCLRLRCQSITKPTVTAASALINDPNIGFSNKKELSEIQMSSSTLSTPTPTPTSSVTQTLVQTSVQATQAEIVATNDCVTTPSPQQSTSSLIKSLLANKVNQRQQKQKDQILQTVQQPIKVASTAISALVNNPLMQHASVKVGQTTIKPLNTHHSSMDKKSIIMESAPPPLAPLSGGTMIAKDPNGRTVIYSSQALTDISSAARKRKITDDIKSECNKRPNVEHAESNFIEEEVKVTPSKRAANLYAELAAEILEEGDIEEVQAAPASATSTQDAAVVAFSANNSNKIHLNQAGISRQVMFQQPNTSAAVPSHLKLTTQNGPQAQLPAQIIQQVLQQTCSQQQQQLQYVLTTNQQTGQTYLVAQQANPSQQTQAVLVTQTPQQQGTGAKTIYILQQPATISNSTVCAQQLVSTGNMSGGQKLVMTTAQGQQVLVTQRPQSSQQQFIINAQTASATVLQRQQAAVTQMSPSLLSQLNQIPATIKPYQPQTQSAQQTAHLQASVGRISKSVSLSSFLPTASNLNNISLQAPPLPQHQPIVQHTIISTPAIEKRSYHVEANDAVNYIQAQFCQKQALLNSPLLINKQQIAKVETKAVCDRPPAQDSGATTSHSINEDRAVDQIMSTNRQNKNLADAATHSRKSVQTISHNQQQQLNLNTQDAYMQEVSSTATATATATVSMHLTDGEKTSLSLKEESLSNTALIQQTVTTSTPVPVTAAPSDVNWLYICDWRNCPRHKFKSLNDLQHHVFTIHCPDHLDISAEIFCQWGAGPGLCDSIPRKRFSLMTHLGDRHLTNESLRAAVKRRISTGIFNLQPAQQPVTIVRNVDAVNRVSSSSPALSSESSSSSPSYLATNAGGSSTALHAIKRNLGDFLNPKDIAEESEGPLTKSIRLTAALILRNLVTYTTAAKRSLRRYESRLSNIALSNAEANVTVSQILFELQD